MRQGTLQRSRRRTAWMWKGDRAMGSRNPPHLSLIKSLLVRNPMWLEPQEGLVENEAPAGRVL